MPVRLERLVPLLLLLLLTCWLLRWILISSLAGPALAMAGFTVQQLGAGPGSDTETRAEFSRTLQQSQLPAFFLETPGVTRDTLDSVIFEFVLLPADHLVNIQPDQQTFAEHFNACKKGRQVVSFPNLGGDSLLVSPCPSQDDTRAYSSLASFTRSGPPHQQEELWATTATAMLDRLDTRGGAPVWLSTEGSGVSWLHIRLDDRPKYYKHRPYRQRAR